MPLVTRTTNMRHLPAETLSPFNIVVKHPDEFIVHQFSLDQGKVLSALRIMRGRLTRPTMSADEFLANLERKGLAGTVAELRRYVTIK